jgi:rod shape-determining protein MreD
MNSSVFINNSARFILLLAAQILIFNYFDLLGFINPYPYILFIILFPVNGNKSALLFAAFTLGIIIDLFLNSGGVHAFACVVLAYLRPNIFKFAFGLSYEYQTVKLNDILTPERFSFILVSVLIHHLCLFFLEVFSVTLVWNMLYISLFSIIATIIISIIIIYLIKPKRR